MKKINKFKPEDASGEVHRTEPVQMNKVSCDYIMNYQTFKFQ